MLSGTSAPSALPPEMVNPSRMAVAPVPPHRLLIPERGCRNSPPTDQTGHLHRRARALCASQPPGLEKRSSLAMRAESRCSSYQKPSRHLSPVAGPTLGCLRTWVTAALGPSERANRSRGTPWPPPSAGLYLVLELRRAAVALEQAAAALVAGDKTVLYRAAALDPFVPEPLARPLYVTMRDGLRDGPPTGSFSTTRLGAQVSLMPVHPARDGPQGQLQRVDAGSHAPF